MRKMTIGEEGTRKWTIEQPTIDAKDDEINIFVLEVRNLEQKR